MWLKTTFLYIKKLFHLKDFGTECAPYYNFVDLSTRKEDDF